MASPGVITREFDLTLNANTEGAAAGAMVGTFRWGPVNHPVLITTNESELVRIFGTPDNDTTLSFHSALNYLLYSSPLYIVRAIDDTTAKNAYPTGETADLILNYDDYQAKSSANAGISFVGRYPGQIGNAIEVSCADASAFDTWDYKGSFDYPPTDEDFHVAVIDATGAISGTSGTVIETFGAVNKVPGSRRDDGTSAYVKDVIESQSNWVWLFDEAAILFTETGSVGIYEVAMQGGVDANAIASADFASAADPLENSETINFVSLFTPNTDATVVGTFVDIADSRADSICFTAPNLSDVFNVAGSTALANVNTYFTTTLNKNTSYAFNCDNWKLVYDKYANRNIWIPCNSDTAALWTRLFTIADPWLSPAGENRGMLKNVIKLAWNPKKEFRDSLYGNSINSIVSFAGQGTMLFGDKTALRKKSAFSRINVRALMIVLKKAISEIGRSKLFEFNDLITRSTFAGAADRYLDTVQARMGVQDKLVVCDETNNTPNVIESNEFVGTIYIKPNYSINTVKLGFVAVSGGVDFAEVEGQSFGF